MQKNSETHEQVLCSHPLTHFKTPHTIVLVLYCHQTASFFTLTSFSCSIDFSEEKRTFHLFFREKNKKYQQFIIHFASLNTQQQSFSTILIMRAEGFFFCLRLREKLKFFHSQRTFYFSCCKTRENDSLKLSEGVKIKFFREKIY